MIIIEVGTMKTISLIKVISLLLVSLYATSSFAADHKVVIQISSKDPLTQKIVLNNAVNLQKYYGMDNIDIEVVAYGPGLSIMTKKNPLGQRIASLSHSNIKFSACGNTIKKITKKKGKAPKLVDGIAVVPAGAAYIIELQEKGYAYLRP